LFSTHWRKMKETDILGDRPFITLVVGGCRSGKSRFALNAANAVPGRRKIFLATSVPKDLEMTNRVQAHQAERGKDWITVEEPVNIHESISAHADTADVILVDCLTLWLSNMMAAHMDDKEIENRFEKTAQACCSTPCPVFLVSNEVGSGIVPENSLARKFRDLAGHMNQFMADTADRVVLAVAGQALQIKPGGKRISP
jgi:adenosylcobinamide kinase/adenosylcobinamide-phosphate guanylyltransferase